MIRKNHLNPGYDYLAGICYDIYNDSFSSVYYTLAPKYSEYAEPFAVTNFPDPGIEIMDVEETFTLNNFTGNDFHNQQFQNWINNLNFKFGSVIQHPILNSTFNTQFSSLLQFAWWPNLLLYNWKRYVAALEIHVESENQAYDILAGVSGAIKVPIIENCQSNYTLKEVVDNTNRKIPLYVWNYLQARDNSTNAIVVIGFNSPFYEFYSIDEVIFCPDKCTQIPWLKKASSSFRYSVMGIVFCCSIEDARSSKRLQGFPGNDISWHNYLVNFEPPVFEDNESQEVEE